MHMAAQVYAGLVAAGVLITMGCGHSDPVAPTPPAITQLPPTQSPPPVAQTAVMVGAGDIGDCSNDNARHAEDTARLIDKIPGTVFTVGDAAYPSGTMENFRDCYEQHWGRFKNRTRPTPGNHEYGVAGAFPYFQYFGPNAGAYGVGFYSYDVGAWHVIALNSELPMSAGQEQYVWLQDDLAANNKTKCTLAYFHKARFTSGPSGGGVLLDAWRLMYQLGVDVIVNGHDHGYERFEPQDPLGNLDLTLGIRTFIAGSGGAMLYPFGKVRNSVVNMSRYGVLKLTLRNTDYDWAFIEAATEATLDFGTAACH
jgi:acid phosphatase type 7